MNKKIIKLDNYKSKQEIAFKASAAIRDVLEATLSIMVDEYIENNGEINFDSLESNISLIIEDVLDEL